MKVGSGDKLKKLGGEVKYRCAISHALSWGFMSRANKYSILLGEGVMGDRLVYVVEKQLNYFDDVEDILGFG